MTSPQEPSRHESEPDPPAHPRPDLQPPTTLSLRLPDFWTARQVIEHLERSGVDGARMGFHRDSLERAARSAEGGKRDERFLYRAFQKFRRGAMAGAASGLVLGIMATAAWLGTVLTTATLLIGIAAAAVGALIGAAIGGIWTHQQSPAWEATFEAPDVGEPTLYVQVTNENEAALVNDALATRGGWLEEHTA